MANDNAGWQREYEDIQKEYEDLQKEYEELIENVNEEMAEAESGVSETGMHIFNISVAVVMIVIGGILVYQTCKITKKSSKKIAGWILLILGALTLITHVIQWIL